MTAGEEILRSDMPVPERILARFGCFARRRGMIVAALLLGPWLGLRGAPVKVACIGDSITEGAGLSNAALESYPARLQRLLGTNHVVRNYGVSGRTLLKKGDFPYWKESSYAASRNWAPDVVIIKLGTNDSKPQNWRHGTNFVVEFEEFVGSYRSLASRPRVVLCTPAPVFLKGAFEISPGIVATNIAPSVRGLCDRLGLELIDFQERLAGHGEWFPDTVHPNTRGMAVMSAIVVAALQRIDAVLEPPVLTSARSGANRPILAWPADACAFVLQTAPRVNGAVTNWTVADAVPASDGRVIRLTNVTTAPRFFRLWRP